MVKSLRFIRTYKAYFVVLSIAILVIGLFIMESDYEAYMLAGFVTLILTFLYFYNKNGRLAQDVKRREDQLLLYQDLLREDYNYIELDKNLRVVSVNHNVCQMLGITKDDIVGKALSEFVRLEDYASKIISIIEREGQYQSSGFYRLNDKEVAVDVALQKRGLGQSDSYYLILQKRGENSSVANANRFCDHLFKDNITNLPTRLKLFHDIERHREHALFPKSTLIYLTIDNFDALSEFFGIDAGNIILKRIAEWLQEDLPSDRAKLYKIDFNHFAIYVPRFMKKDDLETYLRKLTTSISREEFSFQESIFSIEITAGVARGSENLPKNAYLALKEAQKMQKSFKIFDERDNQHERFLHNIKINKMVKEAIMKQRVEPFFQPIFNINTNQVEKYESLMRIRQEDNSYATPAEFLDIAKTSKMYTELSRAMIKKCFQQLEKVRYPITINITMEDILEPRVSQFILRNLKKHDFGSYITFEIVESESISNEVKVKNFIKNVKSYGCQIAIDDFGSGFSNFGQLMALDADFIKIDGSLIKNITKDKESEIMTRTIISMAKELNMKTVAEFVSSEAIFKKVKSLGIDYAQGYFIDRADPVLLKQIGMK
jgi:EAL domain-containing protein (putative c-di-GMP-specific phosphodiesterase class I)